MRAPALVAAVLIPAAIGCVTVEEPGPAPPAGDAAAFEAPPPRTVVDDIPPTLGSGLRLDAPAAAGDAPAGARPDAGAAESPRDAAAAARVDAPGSCNLLAQDCPAGRACYPGGAGGQCRPVGSVGELGPCAAHEDCDRGLVCAPSPAGTTCHRLCNTAMPACGGRAPCRALAGNPGVGYCAP
jgi:hypothetical protein